MTSAPTVPRESEDDDRAVMRELLDALPMLASYIGADQRYRYVNQTYELWFGRPRQEIEGRTMREVLGDAAYARVRPLVERVLAGEPQSTEEVLAYRDGGPRTVEILYRPRRTPAGGVDGFYALIRDVSARKTIEHQIDVERQTLGALSRIGSQLATQLEIGELVQGATDAATELTGAQFGAFFYNLVDEQGETYTLYTISGVPREAFARFPMPRNTPVFAPTFHGEAVVRSADITAEPHYGTMEPYHGMPPGHLPVRSYLAVPVVSRGGEVLGGMFFGHSATGVFDERAEQVAVGIAAHAAVGIDNGRLFRALTVSEERFRQVANSIPQLAWTARPDGSIFWYNDRWYEFTGATPEEMLGWGWQSVHDPAELPRVLDGFRAAIAAGTPWEDTFPLRRHDGAYRWHLSRALPIRDAEGKIVLWFGTNTDITDQRQATVDRDHALDAERAARAESDRLSRVKDEFLATLSHELRTPLNSIVSWSHLLQRGTLDAETTAKAVESIARNARVQAQLIEDLLDLSRIVSGKVRLDVQRIDLAEIVAAAIDSVQPTADAKRVRIERVLDPLAGPLAGDPHRLQQVIWNLLTNAIKFTGAGGRVQVLLERVNSHVEISVSDTGVGIKPEFLPHVFDRFHQADASTTRKYGGLGLGLSIVKQLVEMHGGRVHARSPGEGRGATFNVILPLSVVRDEPVDRTHPRADRPADDLDAPKLTGITVLVVDDEPDARELIKRVLEEWEAEVVTAVSASDGLDRLERMRPDVIVSDIGMPDVDGYDFIRSVRRAEPPDRPPIPAVALTAFARSEDRRRALLAGYQSHVAKPMDPAELVTVIATLVRPAGDARG